MTGSGARHGRDMTKNYQGLQTVYWRRADIYPRVTKVHFAYSGDVEFFMKDTDDTPPIMRGWDDAEPTKTWKPSTASVWGRVWGRVDLTAERFGAPSALQRVNRQWATVEWRDIVDWQARRWWGSPEFCAHHEAEKVAHLNELVSGPPPPMSRGKFSNPRWIKPSQAISAAQKAFCTAAESERCERSREAR